MRDNLVTQQNPPIADIPECDRMTVLTTCSDRQVLTKRHTIYADGKPPTTQSYDTPAFFKVYQGPAGNLGQLVRAFDETSQYPRCCFIRGEPVEGINWQKTRRLAKDHPEKGKATFREAPRRQVILDIDDFPHKTDNPLDLVNGDLMAREIRKRLPKPFRNVACVWQLTSGAGLFLIDDRKPALVKMRLGFISDKPLGRNQLESMFAGTCVDMSLFRPVQPCYVAAPIFQRDEFPYERLPDPLFERGLSRTGVIEGEGEVIGIEPANLTLVASNDQPRPRTLKPIKAEVTVPAEISNLPPDPLKAEGYTALQAGVKKNINPGEVLAYGLQLVQQTPEAGPNKFGGHGRHHALLCGVRFFAKHYVKRQLIQPDDVVKAFHSVAMAMGLEDIDRHIRNAFDLAEASMDRLPGVYPLEGLPVAEVSPEAFEVGWREELITHYDPKAEAEVPDSNIHNAILFLRFSDNWKDRLRYDELAQRIVVNPPWENGDDFHSWTDDDDVKTHAWFSTRNEEITIDLGFVRACVAVAAKHNSFHPVADYLNGLKWDGQPRVDDWISSYCPPPGDVSPEVVKFVKAVSAAFFVSAVARALSPGCKVDHVLVLVSPQGTGKSSTFAALMPVLEWFADQMANIESKDASQDLAGKWLLELAELSVMRRAKDAEAIKAFVTRRIDHYRPSYGRSTMDFKRSCIFAGTTNDRQFLSDKSGNRRFWPVEVGRSDIEAIKRDRDQLWAEAVHRFKSGEQWWLPPEIEAIARGIQADHLEVDPLEEKVLLIADQISEGRSGNPHVTVSEICERLNMHDSQRGGAVARRVGDILASNGWGGFVIGDGRKVKQRRAWRRCAVSS